MTLSVMLIDFDGTLYRGDSFISYVRHQGVERRYARYLPSRARKTALLWHLARRESLGLGSFLDDFILPAVDWRVVDFVKDYRADLKIVVSASLETYLVPACRSLSFNVDGVVATRLPPRGWRFRDCNGREKLRRVEALLREREIRDYQLISIGDSLGDYHLFRRSSKAYFCLRSDNRGAFERLKSRVPGLEVVECGS